MPSGKMRSGKTAISILKTIYVFDTATKGYFEKLLSQHSNVFAFQSEQNVRCGIGAVTAQAAHKSAMEL